MTYSQNYLDTAHLLRRAGFSASPDQVQAASELGLAATTNRLIYYEKTPDEIDDDAIVDKLKQILPDAIKAAAELRLPVRLVQVWWIYRMLASDRPLQEKMTLFWHNHFTSNDNDGGLMLSQNQLYRRNALGNFRTLTLEVSKNPEMLKYLNGNQNFKAHPNENYGRELMELFTCGRVNPQGQPNYTEDDVKAGARAFSGWTSRGGEFFYNANQHDETDKTFMGHTGDLNGDDVVDILVSLPATASYLCNKLFRFFAYEDPEPAVTKALVDTYYSSGYEVRPIVEQILTSNAFYSAKARNAIIKSPADFVVGSVKMLDLTHSFVPPVEQLFGDDPNAPPPTLPLGNVKASAAGDGKRRQFGQLGSPVGRLLFLDNQMRNMGQDLFAPPTVKGWDGGAMWINTDTLQARARFATAISSLPDLQMPGQNGGAQVNNTSFGSSDSSDNAQVLDGILNALGPLQIELGIRQAILDYAAQEKRPQQCARGMLSLAMGTPEYQLA